MISELINEIISNKLSLTQILTKAKVIAFRSKNEILIGWVASELEGYSSELEIPRYRILEVETIAAVIDPFGRKYDTQVSYGPNLRSYLENDLHRWYVNDSIVVLEEYIGKAKTDFVYVQFSPSKTDHLNEFVKMNQGIRVENYFKKIGVSQISGIINRVRQNLLDILLKLEREYPNIENNDATTEDILNLNRNITDTIYKRSGNDQENRIEEINMKDYTPQIKFSKLKISNWKQFEEINIDFHPHVTIMTGANGSGKTTILNLLSRHFGWEHLELATPTKEKSGIIKFLSRIFSSENASDNNIIGELFYTNDKKSNLVISENNTAKYSIAIPDLQNIKGISIPSHRPTYLYRPIENLSTTKRSKKDAFELVLGSSKSYYFNGGGKASNYFLKETLIGWAIGGVGNIYITPDAELKKYFEDFQNILRKIMPPSIGFRELSIRNYEVVLITESGEFMLDAVSGGVSTIMDLAWQIFTYSNSFDEEITVLIDEIENHLHPEMQRSILPNLISAFPNIQFIISTHSPLIVGSVKNSNVYVFRHKKMDNSNQIRIINEKLDLVNKAKTASEILDEVLGVSFTMPIWVESQLNDIIHRFTKEDLTEQTFDEMRTELERMGLEELMPLAIKKILKRNDKTE
ncbi:MAG: AAA family ATPase [Saprospiraceae bacterium]|nr:AAA family ATPase [Saprospiraceae bacterium]